MALPVGFVYDSAGRVVLDPDGEVRSSVSYLFATFARTGSARATVKAFAAEGVKFPVRLRSGADKGTPLTEFPAPTGVSGPKEVRRTTDSSSAPSGTLATRKQGPHVTADMHVQAGTRHRPPLGDARCGMLEE